MGLIMTVIHPEDSGLGNAFRQAMRRLASTVTLITSGSIEEPAGMAATAVASITADPPTLMIAVNRNSAMFGVLEREQRFCVNLLAERHGNLVSVFGGARKGRERFEFGEWGSTPDGLPVLRDAAASLVCSTCREMDVGTHRLFIGEVEEIVLHPDIAPLVWMDGGLAHAARVSNGA